MDYLLNGSMLYMIKLKLSFFKPEPHASLNHVVLKDCEICSRRQEIETKTEKVGTDSKPAHNSTQTGPVWIYSTYIKMAQTQTGKGGDQVG